LAWPGLASTATDRARAGGHGAAQGGRAVRVSQLAQDAAIASLAAEAELFERVEHITKERGRVLDALRDQGWPVPASEGNFVWLRLGERTLEFAERRRTRAWCAAVRGRGRAGLRRRARGQRPVPRIAEAFRS